jgi:predicted small secreted protein
VTSSLTHRANFNAITPHEEKTMKRTVWPLAALATLAVLVAGCGNGTQGVPAGAGNIAAPSGGNGTGSIHEKAVKFAECMRANGVSAFPDPAASGSFTIDAVVNGSSLDPSSAAWKKAVGACKNLEPPGFTGGKVTPSQRTSRLKFAQCMRDNGVPDFPDPTPNGPLIDTNRIPSLAGKDPRNDPGLNAAMQTCRDFAAAAGVTGGP